MNYILREITPLDKGTLLHASYYPDNRNNFPLHFHEDFELTLAFNGRGKRIIGNHVDEFPTRSLALKGPNVQHCYKRNDEPLDIECEMVVIQFRKDFHLTDIFNTWELQPIRDMLQRAATGIIFSEQTAEKVKDKMCQLAKDKGFGKVTLFLDVLNEIAISSDQLTLSTASAQSRNGDLMQHSRRINKILTFVEVNYRNKISLDDISLLIGMPPSSASRFFKLQTKQKFWDYLSNYRIDQAALMIVETSRSVSEICYECGFNNLSNFNRVFKARIGVTPSEHRRKFKDYLVPNQERVKIIDNREKP